MATTQHPTFMSTEMSSEVISPMSLTYAEVTALDIDYSQPADNGDAHRSPYESFCFYARSPTADTRDMAVRSIARTLSTLDSVTNRFEIETVFDILKNSLAKDENFQARCSLIEQIPLLYIEFHQIDYLMYEADALLSHILASSLDNTLELVRKFAIDAISTVLEQRLLSTESLETIICPVLIEQSLPSRDNTRCITDQQRSDAVTLLCKIVTFPNTVSKRWIFDNFLGLYTRLLVDSVFHVRKVSVTILGSLSRMYGRGLTERLFVPYLCSLCEDSVWGVRKICCEVFVDVAVNCSLKVKRKKLAPKFIKLLRDRSRWVVCVGYQRLGHFIATFADSSQTGLEVCNGRLVFIEKPISASSSCSFPNNDGLTECNEKLEVEDEFDALPPHAVLPKVEAHETTPRTSSPPIAEDPMLNELTGLLDSWTSDISRRTARNAHSSILDELNGPGGAAAYCSTHNDLSKLGVDDDDFMDEEVEEENGEDAQQLEKGSTKVSTSQQTDDDFNTLTYWSNEPLLGQSDELHYGSCGSKRSTVDVSVYFERSLCAVYKNSAVACNIESLEGKDHNDHLQPEDEITPVIDDETLMDDVPDSELERTFVVKRAARLAHLDDSDEEFGELSDDDTEDVIESNAVLEQNIVPQDLLDSYVHMLSPNSSEQIDISRHCAHSFPAVAFTLGRRNWYCLKGIYKKLASDMQWRVRQSLASSMHEVAAIIGSENTDQHLVPIFEQFMRDIEDVKVGLLKHLFEFFQLVTPSTRRKLLSVLANFLHSDTDNERNWRFRREFTRQCILLCDLYNVEDVNTYLAAIALTLANDRISDVRKEAATLLAHILGKFVAKEWHDDSSPCDELSMPVTGKFVADIVNGFCRSKNWQRRQTFTVFCERAFRLGDLTPKQFSLLLLNDLIRLSNDPVANVRLSFIRAISATQKDILFTQHDYSVSVRRSIQLLVEDADMDCRREARLALGMIDTENVIDVQKRGERLREQEEVLMMQWHTAENCDTSVISRS